MVQVWYMVESAEDPTAENHLDPPEYVPLEQMPFLSGVELFKIDVDNINSDMTLKTLRDENHYDHHDIMTISSVSMPNYDEKIKVFYTEHLHDDDEIRLFLEGSGYFDVRDMFDRWIRIKAEKGDLIVLPAGCYHRFTPDEMHYAKVMRLFSGVPQWRAFNRTSDKEKDDDDAEEEVEDPNTERESRVQHLNLLGKNALRVLKSEIPTVES